MRGNLIKASGFTFIVTQIVNVISIFRKSQPAIMPFAGGNNLDGAGSGLITYNQALAAGVADYMCNVFAIGRNGGSVGNTSSGLREFR